MGAAIGFVRNMRALAVALGFVLPLAALTLAGGRLGAGGLAALGLAQLAGLLAERWIFFADARHPQNLYSPSPYAASPT